MIKLHSTKCRASSNTNIEADKPTCELVISFLWQWCPLVFTATSIVGATHENASEDLSHPVQKQIATWISTLKDFTRIRVVQQPAEPHIRNVNKGRRPGGGWKGGGGSCAWTTLETGAKCLPPTQKPMTTFIPNKSKIKPKRHLTCNCLIPS